jgi:formate/nitrite transporter
MTVNGFSPQEIANLVSAAGVAKSKLSYADYAIKSFLGGVFIALGGLVDLTILSGSPGLRESNPSLATMISGFTFPLGFVLITLTNMELCTSNMFVMPFTLLQRRVAFWDLAKNWVLSYVFNAAGCLFVAGFLGWWSQVLTTDTQTSYAVTQAQDRVNVGWSVNFLRGVGCNFFVALAFILAIGAVEFVSKIYCIWVPVWAFVIAGYQHSIANYFLIPMGMFYGTEFNVGRFIYQSIIPVTLGNIVGGVLLGALPFWFLYGRGPTPNVQTGQPLEEKKVDERTVGSDETAHESGSSRSRGKPSYDRDGMVNAA